MRYWLHKNKETFLHWFWQKVPKSFLYWAVISAWAKATTSEYSNKHPDEVTWSMMMKFLDCNKP